MQVMTVVRAYVTDHGEFMSDQLPPDLASALASAVFRKDGYIDRRYTATRLAWRDLQNWALGQYNTQDRGHRT